MENKIPKDQKSFLKKYDKSIPVQNEFLSRALETSNLIVVNESLCLYD